MSNNRLNLAHLKWSSWSPPLPCLLCPQSPENGHSIFPGAQAKIGSHLLIQFIDKSCRLCLKNPSTTQAMSRSFLQMLWSKHLHLDYAIVSSLLSPPLPCTSLQCILNTAASDPVQPNYIMSFLCPEPSTGCTSQNKSQSPYGASKALHDLSSWPLCDRFPLALVLEAPAGWPSDCSPSYAPAPGPLSRSSFNIPWLTHFFRVFIQMAPQGGLPLLQFNMLYSSWSTSLFYFPLSMPSLSHMRRS